MTAPRHFHQAVAAAKAGIRKGDTVTRPTAAIVADLRDPAKWNGTTLREAADRLAELDAQLAAVIAALDQYDKDMTTLMRGVAADALVLAVTRAVGR